MNDQVFNSFRQEHRPLLRLLEQRSRTARDAAHGFPATRDNEAGEAELSARFLSDWASFAQPVQRAGPPAPLFGEPQPVDRQSEPGKRRHYYWRWHYRIPLSGNSELLDYWPAECDVEPCESELNYEPAPEYSWRWTSAKAALSLAIDVSRIDDPEGDVPPAERLLAAVRYLDGMITAVNGELAAYDQGLKQDIASIVSERLRRLGVIAERNAVTIELVAREAPVIEIVEAVSPRGGHSGPVPQVHVDGEAISLGLAVTEATFADFLRVCERWKRSAQAYPRPFENLREEDITSILVTTLNTSFDTAQREVFSGKGKTDIYVEMSREDRTRAAYIGEAKIWGRPSSIPAHFDQLLGYVVEHTREALLLYYVRNRQIDTIRRNAMKAIEALPFWDGWIEHEPLVARVHHPTYEFPLKVAVIFVHVPSS